MIHYIASPKLTWQGPVFHSGSCEASIPRHTDMKNIDLYQDGMGTKMSLWGEKSPEEASGKMIWKKNPMFTIH